MEGEGVWVWGVEGGGVGVQVGVLTGQKAEVLGHQACPELHGCGCGCGCGWVVCRCVLVCIVGGWA